jgi:hypothetical protein
MGTGERMTATVAALGIVFAVAWGVGAATGPRPPEPAFVPATEAVTDAVTEAVTEAAATQPAPSRVALVDGYRVRLDGELVPGGPSQVFATVTRDGVAVTDLEPHLGGFGHLVALRLEDLDLLRVQPTAPPPAPTDRSGPGVAFTTGTATTGTYRLFLEFRHGGVLRTVSFTVATRELS